MNDAAVTYEIAVSREHSTDFLEEARGALLQAQVERLAEQMTAEDALLSIARRFGPGSVSLVISAGDPEQLWELADEALCSFGYELPEPDTSLGHTPEELDALCDGAAGADRGADRGATPQVDISMGAPLAHRAGNAIADLMRGSLISPASRNDLKVLASELQEKAFRAARRSGEPRQ